MDLNAAIAALARDPNARFDVAELALLLAREEYADLDVEAYLGELAGIAPRRETISAAPCSAKLLVCAVTCSTKWAIAATNRIITTRAIAISTK